MVNKKGCVYFFRHKGLTPVKIGFSSETPPMKRYNSLRTYAPFGVDWLGIIESPKAKEIEKQLHKKYFGFRRYGEWFEITEDTVKSEIDFYSKNNE